MKYIAILLWFIAFPYNLHANYLPKAVFGKDLNGIVTTYTNKSVCESTTKDTCFEWRKDYEAYDVSGNSLVLNPVKEAAYVAKVQAVIDDKNSKISARDLFIEKLKDKSATLDDIKQGLADFLEGKL